MATQRLQSWELVVRDGKVNKVRIKPDVVNGQVMDSAEYNLRELREMFWALQEAEGSRMLDANPPTGLLQATPLPGAA